MLRDTRCAGEQKKANTNTNTNTTRNPVTKWIPLTTDQGRNKRRMNGEKGGKREGGRGTTTGPGPPPRGPCDAFLVFVLTVRVGPTWTGEFRLSRF